MPSGDGKWIATWDKDQVLSLVDAATGKSRAIDSTDTWADFQDVTWSPDSRWLAYVEAAPNLQYQVWIYDTSRGTRTAVTNDWTDSWSPAWSPDGKWLWFLSDRHFETVVRSVWGSRQPDPFFDQRTKVYGVSLQSTFRSPFEPADELHLGDASGEGEKDADKDKAADKKKGDDKKKSDGKAPAAKPVEIALDGLAARLIETPMPPRQLRRAVDRRQAPLRARCSTEVEPKSRCGRWRSTARATTRRRCMDDVTSLRSLRPTARSCWCGRRTTSTCSMPAARPRASWTRRRCRSAIGRSRSIPSIEWRQMYTEAWRLERDYFYDRAMHGSDWKAIRERYRPLADRVTDRAELADVFQQMVGELTALHMYVYGGDVRRGSDPADPASLGAALAHDAEPVAGASPTSRAPIPTGPSLARRSRSPGWT